MTQVVTAADGRALAVDSIGAPDGKPVFLLHGTPGSRHGPRPRGVVLQRLGVRLICYDRPGYGGSSRRPGRTVSDSADDVSAIADALGLGAFGVVGRSGGGPHALACAALLPGRVERAAVLVGLAPADAPDLDWFAGMTRSNVEEYTSADVDASAVEADLAERTDHILHDPEYLLRFLLPELTSSDRRVIEDVGIRRLLIDTYAEALRRGPDGWIDDVLGARRPWKFELSDISVPVLLWHGADDMFSPVEHTRWLADQIAHVTLKVEPGVAHFGAVEVLPQVLAWMVDPAARSRFASAGTGFAR